MSAQRRDQSQQQQSPGTAGESGSRGQQTEESRQSAKQPGADGQQDGGKPSKAKAGIGSSQGHDKAAREHGAITGEGTADLLRSSVRSADVERGGGGSQDSMVNDPTGAFKERP